MRCQNCGTPLEEQEGGLHYQVAPLQEKADGEDNKEDLTPEPLWVCSGSCQKCGTHNLTQSHLDYDIDYEERLRTREMLFRD